MSSIMMRIGILFAVLGFGSLILEQFDYEFRLIAWASDMQPGFGIVLGLVGLALVGGSVAISRAKAPKPQQQFAQPAPGGQFPGQPQPYAGQPQAQQQYPQQPGQPG